MSNLTSVINVNVPSDVKEEATNLFNSLGYKKVILHFE